jgi:hypothetical protein
MAINFLNSIDLNQLELLHATIENQATDVLAGTGVAGQVYYNTTDELIKVWDGTLSQWKAVGKYDDLSLATTNVITNVARVDLEESGSIIGSAVFSSAGSNSGIAIVGSGSSIAIAHADTSSVADSDNSNGVVLQDITFDTFGHVQTIGTTDLDNRYVSTITGGDGIAVTGGATNSATVAVDYLGSDNYILSSTFTPGNVTSNDVIPYSDGTTNTVERTTLGNIPINALTAVKQYVDSATVGSLIYQSGYSAAANFPNLENPVPNNIKKGWTYTVTSDGLFFTEQVRIGDLLIAEVDAPTQLSDWTTVQNNVDLADLATVGIGNVNSSTQPERKGLSAVYTNGTANIGLDLENLPTESSISFNTISLPYYSQVTAAQGLVNTVTVSGGGSNYTNGTYATTVTSGGSGTGLTVTITTVNGFITGATVYDPGSGYSVGDAIGLVGASGTGASLSVASLKTQSSTNYQVEFSDLASGVSGSTSTASTISAGQTSGVITHNLNTYDVIVQAFDDTTKETVYADVDRTSINAVTVTFGAALTNAVRVLIQKIG